MYKKGDFHVHSTESDGELNPGEIVLLAKERHLDIVALTDHNTVNGNRQAIKAGKIHGVKIIPGIELSTRYQGNKIHILGYFYNDKYDSKEFKTTLNNINRGRYKGCQITCNGKVSFNKEGGRITTKSGIEFLHFFGAKVVLAHPTLLKQNIFNRLIDLKFDGIEAKYYRNKENDTERFINIAKRKGIVYSAGSDFHSLRKTDVKHGTLGQVYLNKNEIKNFLKILE